jgi:hypothetical protein
VIQGTDLQSLLDGGQSQAKFADKRFNGHGPVDAVTVCFHKKKSV